MASEEREITKGIKILDIAYPRLRAPDLDVVEEFFIEFGMVRAARTETALYMRGTGPAHHLHITEKGEPGFVSMAYYARSAADLETIARHPDAISGVLDIDEPGGGKRVLLKEPNNGFVVEIVFGIATVPELPIVVPHTPLQRRSDEDHRQSETIAVGAGTHPAYFAWRTRDARSASDHELVPGYARAVVHR